MIKYIDLNDDNHIANYLGVTPPITNAWFAVNNQRVFVDGTVISKGGWYVKDFNLETPRYKGDYSASLGITFRSKSINDGGDPILQWEGVLSNNKIINYESSKTLRLGVGNLNTGSNYEEYNRAPSVNTWLGRSWIENEHEELYFLVESREMLDEVATYYGLPVPYDDGMKVVLDNNLQSIRFKSYDLNNEGEGNYVAVVVASITFVNDTATTLKLYETTRWNE